MQQAKFLITGAAGDTGGYAIEQLLQKGHPVRALVDSRGDRSKRLEDTGVELVAGDYLDPDAMRAAVKAVHRTYYVYPIRPGLNELLGPTAKQSKEMLSTGVPFGRLGTPGEIAKPVVFSRIRRQQLHDGCGTVCGWRLRTSLSRDRVCSL